MGVEQEGALPNPVALPPTPCSGRVHLRAHNDPTERGHCREFFRIIGRERVGITSVLQKGAGHGVIEVNDTLVKSINVIIGRADRGFLPVRATTKP